ncbi:MAG: cytidine deaminase [Clostridiales bacterium]|jgi:cytidine deaminase|nr:cytidine deaminase [Clostridiales bacterium]
MIGKRPDCLEGKTIKELIASALQARVLSYCPYSGFAVGAALAAGSTDNITIYTGCNIENSAFSPSVCAERVAIFKAISEGCDPATFKAIAIVGEKNGSIAEGTSSGSASAEESVITDGSVPDYCPPCGVCRQVMSEFCDPDNFTIILAKNTDEYKTFTLRELMPESFGL